MYKLRTGTPQGVAEGKAFIVDMRERTPKGICESPEQRESSTLNMASRRALSTQEGVGEREEKTVWQRRPRGRGKRGRQKRRTKMTEMAGLCSNEKLGEGKFTSCRSLGLGSCGTEKTWRPACTLVC